MSTKETIIKIEENFLNDFITGIRMTFNKMNRKAITIDELEKAKDMFFESNREARGQ